MSLIVEAGEVSWASVGEDLGEIVSPLDHTPSTISSSSLLIMSRANTQNGNSLPKKSEDDGELTSLLHDLTVEPNSPPVSRSALSHPN